MTILPFLLLKYFITYEGIAFDINILLTKRRKGAKRKHRQPGSKSLFKISFAK